MPANRFNAFTDYGVGIGLRVPHYSHILSEKPVVDWFEIISENYMVDGGRPLKILDQILGLVHEDNSRGIYEVLRDISACCLVSRQFHAVGTNWLYRHVPISDPYAFTMV